MKLLEGKTTLITGASRGIGRIIALEYAKNGSNVAFTYLSSVEQGRQLEGELKQFGIKAQGYQSDASDYNQAQELVDKVIKDFGKLDILINNAGITKDGLLLRQNEESWDKVIRVNLKSVFNTVKASIKPFMAQRSGSIINMSSVVGLQGNIGQTNYAASKAGIIGFSRSVAVEWGSRNIRCNVVAPGFIETEMTEQLPDDIKNHWKNNIKLKRFGTPTEVANCCVFLGSDMGAYITGQVIQVDGGITLG